MKVRKTKKGKIAVRLSIEEARTVYWALPGDVVTTEEERAMAGKFLRLLGVAAINDVPPG